VRGIERAEFLEQFERVGSLAVAVAIDDVELIALGERCGNSGL